MNDLETFSHHQAQRLLMGIGAVLLGAVLCACLTAPPLYHLFSWLARYLTASRHLQELEFGRVVTRAFLVYLIVFSVIAVRRVHHLTWSALGLPRMAHWRKALVRGSIWGVVTLGALLLWALVGGGMEWAPPVWTRWVPRLITYAVGAVLIGFIEEIFFRGALFGMSRRLMPWFWAALWTSLFFSFVHFISPRFPEEAVTVDAWSGFRILPHLVNMAREPEFYWPLSLNLFLIGMVLCTWYQREGHC